MHDGCIRCAGLSRRAFLGAGLGAGLGAAALAAWPGRVSASGKAELMLLNCMDPRLLGAVNRQMEARKLAGNYSQVVLAGGPVAAVAPALKTWRTAVWGNLDATFKLHGIKRVFGLAHIDCGAVKIAYGEGALASPAAERALLIGIDRKSVV